MHMRKIKDALERLANEAAEFEHRAIAELALSHLRSAWSEALSNEGMADCMDLLRRDMIQAGIIGESVPPMFMSEAILGYIGKLQRDAAKGRLREINYKKVRKIVKDQKVATRVAQQFLSDEYDRSQPLYEQRNKLEKEVRELRSKLLTAETKNITLEARLRAIDSALNPEKYRVQEDEE